ncbi:MAG: hypothetical protein A3G35_20005 [candidate division NC10 bacterium RIFCSPLOWO2_12_FULL_66_18]|nr:MAG: hypothetical protein A3G35_20005 [candidate division NC10 bacterium RIFCSPLOWO2_12_FULL_66_18]HLC20995.1 hypothetical protein [Candidatus Methylomirabilis sp.]
MPEEDLIRRARVRLRPHRGALGFVVLDVLALASEPILFFDAACPLACSLLLAMNNRVLGTVGSLPTRSCDREMESDKSGRVPFYGSQ